MTLRIAHTADWHIDQSRRPEDTYNVLMAFADQIKEAGVHLVVHAGDWFERRSSPTERNLLSEVLHKITEHAPVFGVYGNHDAPGDLDIFTTLRTRSRVRIESRPTVAPGSSPIWTTTAGNIGLVALPWFSKTHLLSRLPASTSISQGNEAAIQAATELLGSLRAECQRLADGGAVPVVVGHCLVAGSELLTGQTLIGQTVEIAPGALDGLGAAYVALGHIHKYQDWERARVVYSGSTERCNFGEPEQKGWTLIEMGRTEGSVEHIDLPARPMARLNVDWTDLVTMSRIPGFERDALVRFRYRIRPEKLHEVDEDRIRAALLDAGAYEVKMESVLVHDARVRSEEIATATSTWDKVQAYWKAKQVRIDDETRERIRAKLDRLEIVTVEETVGGAA